jgi:hypothetical protein
VFLALTLFSHRSPNAAHAPVQDDSLGSVEFTTADGDVEIIDCDSFVSVAERSLHPTTFSVRFAPFMELLSCSLAFAHTQSPSLPPSLSLSLSLCISQPGNQRQLSRL